VLTVAVVTVEGLVIRRAGRLLLRSIGCELERGSLTALVGPSGCGKTTLMRAIVGIQSFDSGRITVLGEAADAPRLRGRVGYVAPEPSLEAELTVRESLRPFAGAADAGLRRIDAVIETVALGQQADRVVCELSSGELARASLATALLGDPELLVLDQPTAGLDPVLRQELWTHFRRLAATGVTLFVSTGVMDEVGHCDRVLIMRDGELAASDTPDGLRRLTGEQNLEEAYLWLIQQRS
jgi:ABC-2 type transport system ATP-binding protein